MSIAHQTSRLRSRKNIDRFIEYIKVTLLDPMSCQSWLCTSTVQYVRNFYTASDQLQTAVRI